MSNVKKAPESMIMMAIPCDNPELLNALKDWVSKRFNLVVVDVHPASDMYDSLQFDILVPQAQPPKRGESDE